MIRIFGIALVILGLIVQPLMAAAPNSVPLDETSSSVSMDHSDLDFGKTDHNTDHNTTSGDQSSLAPCHGVTVQKAAVVEEAGTMSCTDCDGDCASGACASACALSAAAVLNQTLLTFQRLSAVQIVSTPGAQTQGLPSRIFHPPKHA